MEKIIVNEGTNRNEKDKEREKMSEYWIIDEDKRKKRENLILYFLFPCCETSRFANCEMNAYQK